MSSDRVYYTRLISRGKSHCHTRKTRRDLHFRFALTSTANKSCFKVSGGGAGEDAERKGFRAGNKLQRPPPPDPETWKNMTDIHEFRKQYVLIDCREITLWSVPTQNKLRPEDDPLRAKDGTLQKLTISNHVLYIFQSINLAASTAGVSKENINGAIT